MGCDAALGRRSDFDSGRPMADRRDYSGGYKARDGWESRQRTGQSRDSRGGRGGWRGGDRDWEHDRRSDRHTPRGDHPKAYDDKADDRAPGITNVWIGGLPSDITEREIERVCTKFGPVRKVTIKHSQCDTYVFVNYGSASHAREAIQKLDQTDPFSTGTIKVAPASKKNATNKPEDSEEVRNGSQHKKSEGGTAAPREQRRSDWGGSRPEPYGGNGRAGARERSPRKRTRSREAREPRERDRERERSPPPRGSSPRPKAQQAPRPVRVYLSQLPRDMEQDELQEIAAEYGQVLQYELHREGAYKCGWVEYGSKSEAEAAVSELDDRRMDDWTMRLQAYMYPGGGA